MDNIVRRARALERNGAHESATLLGSVARMNVNVFGPQALRAVIRVAVALYRNAAMFAMEVLDSSLE